MENLVDELRRQKETAGQDRRGAGRRFVLARRDEIRTALQEGFTVKEIWQLLADKGAINIRYDAFRVLVRKYVRVRDGAVPSGVEAKAESKKQGGNREPLQVPEKSQRKFVWNPRPKKEDLI